MNKSPYLDLYNSGLTIRAIATQLNISPRKVNLSLKADPGYQPRAAGVRYRSAIGEPLERITFHLEIRLIQQIEKLGGYPSKADFLRSAVKEKLELV